jgi:NAD-dependent deacetylase
MHIFILTGAGVSAESGLGTFRDKAGEGIWAQFDPMKLATPEGFAEDPVRVQEFYNARRANLLGAKPNAAHVALSRLQSALADRAGKLTLVTQNIDNLHEQAGSTDVIHMHGELLKSRCAHCGDVREIACDIHVTDACGRCGAEGGLRPHVVWFGEMPLFLDEIDAALRTADLFVAIGTSGSVYPAAGYSAHARRLGIRTCEINLEPSDNARVFDQRIYGPATQTVPQWVDDTLAARA